LAAFRNISSTVLIIRPMVFSFVLGILYSLHVGEMTHFLGHTGPRLGLLTA
jgi:hypothetical protein